MSLEVETVVAVAVMMAVFSAVAAIGTSLVLGAGFERLRCGFEVIRKQTGFFSDAIHKLEQKVEKVDEQSDAVSRALSLVEAKISNVGDQANSFSESMQKLERKVDIVDKQAGFFGDAIYKLEKKIEAVDAHEDVIRDKLAQHADTDLISTAKTEALVSHAESLLNQINILADRMAENGKSPEVSLPVNQISIPQNMMHFAFPSPQKGENIRFH